MLWTSCGDPVQCLQKLRTKTTREQGMMYGYYRLTGNLVCVSSVQLANHWKPNMCPDCTSTVQAVVADIHLAERQRLKDDHLSTSLRFCSLPMRIEPKD